MAEITSFPIDAQKINDLADAGTIAGDTNFIVQKAGATSATRMSISKLIVEDSTAMLAGQTIDVTAVSPKAFFTTNATETNKGTIELATTAEVLAATDAERAITPSDLPTVEQYLFKEDIAITSANMETYFDDASSVTVTNCNLRLWINNKVVNIYGSITFTQNTAVPTHTLLLNNIGVPALKQAIGVTPPVDAAPGGGVATIEASTTKTLITLNSPYSTNWATGSRVYYLFGSYIKE